jgi:SAM-dependent methyltransferase
MRIYLDEPCAAIEHSFFHIRGWAAHEEAFDDLEVRVNGLKFAGVRYGRPDVAKAFPGCQTTGFSVFAKLDRLAPADEAVIQVRAKGVSFERAVPVSPAALAEIPLTQEAQRRKRRWALAHVSCPACATPLDESAGCAMCGRVYARSVSGPLDFIQQPDGASSLAGPVCSHGYDGEVLRVIEMAEAKGGMVLDCGAGMRPSIRPSVVTTEIFENPSTDVLALNESLPFHDAVFDAVLSLHVLEHVADPFACARELLRVLKPGGTLYAVTPMIVPEHGYPHHYFNPTREGLARLFQTTPAESRIFIPPMGHPINGVHSVLNLYHLALPAPQREKFLNLTVRDLLSQSIEHWVAEDIATAMPEEDRPVLAANFAIELVKR